MRRWPGSARAAVAVTSFASALALAAPASAAVDGTWAGTTSQERGVRLEVDRRLITSVRFSVFHQACNLNVFADAPDTSFRIRRDGSFEMRFFGSSERDDRVTIRGRFTSRRHARGTFRSEQDGANCRDVVTGSWTADRRRDRAT